MFEYPVLIDDSIVSERIYESSKSMTSNRIHIERKFIHDKLYCVASIQYHNAEKLLLNKTFSDGHEFYQVKTNDDVFNFFDYSHFKLGCILTSVFLKDQCDKDKLTTIIHATNEKYNSSEDLGIYHFSLLVEKQYLEETIILYNTKFQTKFKIVENFSYNGEEICIVKSENASMLDNFCLGVLFVEKHL